LNSQKKGNLFRGSGTGTGGNRRHVDKQIVKVGFNYLFNFWGTAPLVAKY